jgi:hypothetical protein
MDSDQRLETIVSVLKQMKEEAVARDANFD